MLCRRVVLFLLLLGLAVLSLPVAAADYSPAAPARRIPRRGWLTLETPHFLLHFPPGEEKTARQVAEAAEAAHRLLVPRLEYLPEEKTHVVLSDTADTANAATSATPYNLIYINPALPGIGFTDGVAPAAASAWLVTLLCHEYAHVLHLDLHAGISTQMLQLFGRLPGAALPNVYQAPAIKEGYAVHQEGMGGAGRGERSFYAMFLRAAAMQNNIPPWDVVLGSYPATEFAAGPPYYLYGYAFLDYVARVYGEDKLTAVLHRSTEKPLEGVNAAFSRVLGRPFANLWEDWQHDLADESRELKAVVGPGLAADLLPQVGSVALWPKWHPDGRQILYGSTGGAVSALRLSAVPAKPGEQQTERALINGDIANAGNYAWHPDGRRLVYARQEYDQDNRLFNDLYMFDTTRGTETRLTKGYRAYSPTLSPDGRYVAFASRQGLESRILVQPFPAGQPQVLWTGSETSGAAPVHIVSLSWSPQGDTIAISAALPEGDMGLFLLPVFRYGNIWITGRLRLLVTGDDLYLDPAWSPDGRLLFFSSDRGGIFAIHAAAVETGACFRVGYALFGAFSPAVSPDGTTLLVTAYDTAGYHLALLPLQPATWQPWPAVEGAAVMPAAEDEVAFGATIIRLTAEEKAQAAAYPAPVTNRPAGRAPAEWERDLMQLVDAAAYTVRPYNSWESLPPRYWLPVWGGPDGAWLTGISTVTQDALGQRRYELGLTVNSTRVGYSLAHEWRLTPLGAGPTWGLRLSGMKPIGAAASSATGSATPGAAEVGIDLSWPRQHTARSSTFTLGAAASTGSQQEVQVAAGTSWLGQGGRAYLRTTTEGNAELKYTLRRQQQVFSARWSTSGIMARPGSWRVQALASLAGSTDPAAYFVGAADSDMPLRGIGARRMSGQLAARVTLEAEKVIFTIERGWGDKPLYLRNISAMLFADAGMAGDLHQAAQSAATFGLELAIASELYYGITGCTARFGLARPFDGSLPYRFYFGLGFTR